MKLASMVLIAAGASTGFIALPVWAQSQGVKDSFVRLGSGVPGVLYEPVVLGPKSAIGIFIMHAEGDYLQFSAIGTRFQGGQALWTAYPFLPARAINSYRASFDFESTRLRVEMDAVTSPSAGCFGYGTPHRRGAQSGRQCDQSQRSRWH